MTATELLALAAVHGVRVCARDGNLVCDGRQSQITALLPAIKAHKPELLAALCLQDETEDLREHFNERAGIMEYDGGLPRSEAELEAAKITATTLGIGPTSGRHFERR